MPVAIGTAVDALLDNNKSLDLITALDEITNNIVAFKVIAVNYIIEIINCKIKSVKFLIKFNLKSTVNIKNSCMCLTDLIVKIVLRI